MSAVNPQELLSLWTREQLSTERATGQLLQHLVSTCTALETMKQKVNALQAQLDSLTPATEPTASSKKKKPAIKK
jgi:hypothetical protein